MEESQLTSLKKSTIEQRSSLESSSIRKHSTSASRTSEIVEANSLSENMMSLIESREQSAVVESGTVFHQSSSSSMIAMASSTEKNIISSTALSSQEASSSNAGSSQSYFSTEAEKIQLSAMAASASLLKAGQEMAQKSPLVKKRTMSKDRFVSQRETSNRNLRAIESSTIRKTSAPGRDISEERLTLRPSDTRKTTISASTDISTFNTVPKSTSRSASVSRRASAQLESISTMEASAHSAEVAEITSRMESATLQSSSNMKSSSNKLTLDTEGNSIL